MFYIKKAQNSCTIVGHRDVLILFRVEFSQKPCLELTPISSTIILSSPEGPNELFTTLAIACVARTMEKLEAVDGYLGLELTILISDICTTDLSSTKDCRHSSVAASLLCTDILLTQSTRVSRLLKHSCHFAKIWSN